MLSPLNPYFVLCPSSPSFASVLPLSGFSLRQFSLLFQVTANLPHECRANIEPRSHGPIRLIRMQDQIINNHVVFLDVRHGPFSRIAVTNCPRMETVLACLYQEEVSPETEPLKKCLAVTLTRVQVRECLIVPREVFLNDFFQAGKPLLGLPYPY